MPAPILHETFRHCDRHTRFIETRGVILGGSMAGRVLLVNPSIASRQRMEQWLRGAGFSTESVATFEEAHQRLKATSPDVLITQVRLGEFNGLHLAIVGQGRRPALVAIVIGAPDAVLVKEAESHGATYLTEPVTEEELVAQVTVLFQEVGQHRRWPRKHVADRVDVEFGESAARIVDLSYGGMLLEVADADVAAPELGSGLRVSLPAFGVSIDAALIWAGRGPSGLLLCGAALAEKDPSVAIAWREVVDRIGFTVQ